MKLMSIPALLGIFVGIEAHVLHFECQDGYTFTAKQKQSGMLLYMPRERITLPQVASDEGVKYSDGTMTLVTKGKDALFSPDVIGGALVCVCDTEVLQMQRHQAPVSQTPVPEVKTLKRIEQEMPVVKKTKGSDFNASGYRPVAWQFHVEDKHQGVFSREEAQEPIRFVLPPARRSGDSTLYMYKDREHRVMIELHDHRCIDAKSKEHSDTTVWVKLDGRTFSGCANLHPQ